MIAPSVFADVIDAATPSDGYAVLIHHVYLDESGTHSGSPAMSLAGYVFEKTQAMRFARDWERDLRRFGLPFAHMTDCATGNGAYGVLSLDERIDSEKALIGHIKRRSKVGVGVAVSVKEYEKALGRRQFAMTPYSFCVSYCVTMIHQWASEHCPIAKFAYFLEAGHDDQHEANRILNAIHRGPQSGSYASHTFVDKAYAPQLQAADMLAWQISHFIKRRDEGHLTPRKDYAALLRPKDVLHEMHEGLIRKWAELDRELDIEILNLLRASLSADDFAYAQSGLNPS